MSWRKLTNDPDSCTYNIYKRAKGATEYSKINTKLLRGTSIKLTNSQLPYDNEVAVTTVAKDGTESEKSTPFLYSAKPFANEWMHIEFDDKVLKRDDYSTKYVWPCDLDGNGEMDAFIVDRLGNGAEGGEGEDDPDTSGTTSATNHKLQAYDINGKLLWTVALGPNVNISSGQNDSGFTTFDQKHDAAYAAGKSVIFDISGDNSSSIAINKAVSPSALVLMNPKGHDYHFTGAGCIQGDVTIKKDFIGASPVAFPMGAGLFLRRKKTRKRGAMSSRHRTAHHLLYLHFNEMPCLPSGSYIIIIVIIESD